VPHSTASSTTNPSARPRFSDRWTSSRNGPNRAWSSHSPRLQNRQLPRAALAQNQHNKWYSYAGAGMGQLLSQVSRIRCFGAARLPAGSTAVTSASTDPDAPEAVLTGPSVTSNVLPP
jgi:hypothetical protein